jgi:hypothetical protein
MGENKNPRSFFGPVLPLVGDCRRVTLRQFVATAVPAAYRADGSKSDLLRLARVWVSPTTHAIGDHSEASQARRRDAEMPRGRRRCRHMRAGASKPDLYVRL